MFKYLCSVSVPLLALCLFLVVKVSCADGLDYIDPPGRDDFQGKCPNEENIRNDIAQRFTDFGDTLNSKMFELENNIIRRLQKYIDNKLNILDTKISEKLDDTSNKNLKVTSDVKDDIYDNIYNLKIKLEDIGKTTLNNSHKLSGLDKVLIDNAKLLKLTSALYDEMNETNVIIGNSLALKSLQNSTLDNANTTDEINSTITVTNLSQIDEPTTKANDFQEIHWSDCKEQEVTNVGGFYDYTKPLNRLDDAGVRNASQSAADPTTSLNMRFGVRADQYAAIVLSPQSKPYTSSPKGLFFKIVLRPKYSTVYAVDASALSILVQVYKDIDLSYANTTLVNIQVSNETLAVHLGSRDAEPLLTVDDSRFKMVKYYAFDAYQNSKGYATFLYDC